MSMYQLTLGAGLKDPASASTHDDLPDRLQSDCFLIATQGRQPQVIGTEAK